MACCASAWWRTEWTYDARGRVRVRKDYSLHSGAAYGALSETRYLYDGLRVLQERSGSNVPQTTYTRGPDLGGGWETAGGIGGLLARTAHSGGSGGTYAHAFYHADGNGNVTHLLRADQTAGAAYRYDPYGRTLSGTGPLAAANTLRFSSKELMAASGLYSYGYRFYDPLTQRWLNRDPIQERGGINLYGFVYNSPVNSTDSDGRIAAAIVGVCAVAIVGGLYIFAKVLNNSTKRSYNDRTISNEIDQAANPETSLGQPVDNNGNSMRGRAIGDTADDVKDLIESAPGSSLTGPISTPATSTENAIADAIVQVINETTKAINQPPSPNKESNCDSNYPVRLSWPPSIPPSLPFYPPYKCCN
jgi:RHS repeat-associated protein